MGLETLYLSEVDGGKERQREGEQARVLDVPV